MLHCLRHILCLLVLSALYSSVWARDRLAVLDVKVTTDGGKQLKPFEVKTLTNDLRRLALEYGGFDVMTDKNILDLLPPDTKIEDCIGECEVQTGRMLGAKYIITGEVGRAGSQLDMLVQFYETTGGTLLSSKSIGGQGYEQLRQALSQKVPSLFKGLAMRGAMIQQKSETLLYLRVSPKALAFRVKLGNRYVDLNDPSIKKLDEGYLIPIAPNLKRRLSVLAKGYMSAEEEILVSEGGVENVSIQLSKELKQASSNCAQDDKSCRADLFVYTTPIGARIYVDGRPALDEQGQQLITEVGNSDQPNLGMVRLTLKPGEHLIEARKPRFVSAQRRVTLNKGDWHQKMQDQPLLLKEDFGRLIIEVEPKIAVIEMDGELVGQSAPLTLNEVEVGAHKLKLIAPEYLPKEVMAVVKRGQDKRVKVNLTPAFSSLQLTVSEPAGLPIKGALVNIDSLGRKGQKYTDAQGQVSYSRLPKGEHLALISHRLYSSSKLVISSKSGGRSQSLNQNLQPNYGYLSIKAPDDPKKTYTKEPVQAQVYLSNGQSLGTLPLSRLKLPAGRQRLRIQPKDSERYTPQELQVTIGIGEESKLKAKLAPRIGDVVIETKPFGAEIWVNGEQWGRAPLKRTLLRGSYTLQVKMPDYDTFTQKFTVLENERVEVKVNLGQNPVLTVRCHPAQAEVWVDGLPKGRSPQTHSARAGEWLIECHHRGAVYEQRERTKDGEVRTVHLTIPQTSIDAERSKTNFIRAMAWGLVGSAGLATLGSGVIYLGPAALEADQRDQAYQRFLGATPAQYDDRFSEFRRLDRSVSEYNDMNQTLLWSSLGLGLAGGALLWLVPSAEPDLPSSTSSSIKQVKAFNPTPNPLAGFKAKGVAQ